MHWQWRSQNTEKATETKGTLPDQAVILDSSVGRAFAFGAGGRGFESRGRTIPNGTFS